MLQEVTNTLVKGSFESLGIQGHAESEKEKGGKNKRREINQKNKEKNPE